MCIRDRPVYYSSSEDFGGFQFNVEGVTILGADGGAAAENGFTVSTSASTVLGFSFDASTISMGNGLLTFLETENGSTDGCLYNVIVSSPDGGEYTAEIDGCNTIVVEGGYVEPVYGCTNEDACNYNAEANTDDGTCEYPQDGFNCDGECEIGEDCLGVCGGAAEEDCLGECNGSAEYDECGECNGDGATYECFDGSFACNAAGCADGAILSFGGVSGNSVQILYASSEDMGGVQFSIAGADISGADGGASAEAGWTVSTSSSTWIGFSFSNTTIPAGSGVLTEINFNGDGSEICFTEAVVSDQLGANAVSYTHLTLPTNREV